MPEAARAAERVTVLSSGSTVCLRRRAGSAGLPFRSRLAIHGPGVALPRPAAVSFQAGCHASLPSRPQGSDYVSRSNLAMGSPDCGHQAARGAGSRLAQHPAEPGGRLATGPCGARGQERRFLRCSLPNPTMPDPVGQPDCGSTGTSACGCGPCLTGLGDTDWTLSALQIAAASLTGPSTWLLVGMTPFGTGRRGR